MKLPIKFAILAGVCSIFSSCGIAVYESSSQVKKQSGKLTVVNESYHEELKAEVSLGNADHGYVAPLYLQPNSKATRRFNYSSSDCDPYSSSENCKRKIQFWGDGHLRAYCYGKDILKVDYSCDSLRCEPIQDNWADVTCHQIQ